MIRHADKSRSNLTGVIASSASEAAFKRQREPRRGWLASFALALGILLCSPAQAHAPGAHWALNDKKLAIDYARKTLNKTQFQCLRALYYGESRWNRSSFNPSGAYGIPQLKNSLIKYMDGVSQVRYGIKYINHRYHGDTCKALKHYRKFNWH